MSEQPMDVDVDVSGDPGTEPEPVWIDDRWDDDDPADGYWH